MNDNLYLPYYNFIWWIVLDLNQRIPREADLQSAGINPSPNYPYRHTC